MKEYVMLFEDFQESLNEAKVKPFLQQMNPDVMKPLFKPKKSFYIKRNDWSDWKIISIIQLIEYSWDYAIKVTMEGMPKPETIPSTKFHLYQISNVDPFDHTTSFDAKGNYIKPPKKSKKGLWTMKTLKKEIKSMGLKDYDESESMDMLMDFINNNQGTLEWINNKAGENYDVIDAADWLYNQFS